MSEGRPRLAGEVYPRPLFTATLILMVTITEIEKLAHLARIKLNDADKESLVKEFDSILNYIDQLQKVEISSDVENRVGAVKNIMRPDVVENSTLEEIEMLLAEAPYREGEFIAVKKIIAQD